MQMFALTEVLSVASAGARKTTACASTVEIELEYRSRAKERDYTTPVEGQIVGKRACLWCVDVDSGC